MYRFDRALGSIDMLLLRQLLPGSRVYEPPKEAYGEEADDRWHYTIIPPNAKRHLAVLRQMELLDSPSPGNSFWSKGFLSMSK